MRGSVLNSEIEENRQKKFFWLLMSSFTKAYVTTCIIRLINKHLIGSACVDCMRNGERSPCAGAYILFQRKWRYFSFIFGLHEIRM